ncbi:TonB-dependent receptor plug domain-containing protein [Litorimonas haliclonae]|uniref:TonB-dependent receptor plug domain-containing protein n=1 Tax=Litorimonas haliclonae TaxID=2081977 RepID=UPI0039EF8850
MKRLLLGVALSAFAANSFAQTQSDFNDQAPQTAEDETANSVDLNSNEIIVTADRIGYSTRDELTAPVTVLTEAEIRNRNQAYISDLLRTVPSLAISQSGGGGSLTNIRLRGSEANHTLILIDGVEVNNPTDGGFDLGGLRSDDVVKIEVLRGEQSALYGSDAVGGVINIITRAGSNTERFRASVEAGSRETLEGQFSGVVPLGNAALSINGNAFTTEGYDVSGLGGEKDGADSRRLSVGLNQVNLAGITFSANGAINLRRTDFDGDTDFDGLLNNTNSETDVKTTTARIDARFALAGFDHLVQSNMVETETETKSSFPTLSTGTRQNASWAAKRTFSDRHDLTLLGEVEREEYELASDPDVPDIYNYGLVADYSFNGEALTLTGSIRQDINDVFADATTWRVGAGYKFGWDGRIRGSVGTGVKNPTLVELFGFFPASRFTGNPDLKPENSLGYSIGYEQDLGSLTLSADYFRSELEDEITTIFNPDFTSTVINLATDSTREGIELAAQWDIADTLYLTGSASFLDSEQDGIEEIRRPEFLASATATWDATDKLSLTVNADHTGSQLDTDFGTFSTVQLGSYTLIGANVRYAVSDIVSVYLRGTNLTDEDYQDVFGYASEGRGVFAGVSADF